MRRTIVHILSGDVWGGAEAAAHGLLTGLASSGLGEPAAILLNEGLLEERLRASGVPVDLLPEKSRSFLSLARALGTLLEEKDPLAVHSHGYKEDILSFLATVGRKKRTLVRTQHGSPYPAGPMSYRAAYLLDRRIARAFFDLHIAVSRAIAADLIRFLPERRVRVIPNGVPLPDPGGLPDVALPFPPDAFVVTSLGRFAGEKRYDLLLHAAARASSRLPELRVLLIGDGPERDRLERIASELLPGKVHFAGFTKEPLALLRKSRLYLLSSDREGLPVSLLEAMALGLPVVATSVGGVPEVVRHGETGIVTAPGSSEALAEGILQIAGDRDRAEAMGRRAMQVVRQEYSLEETVRRTAEAYRDLEGSR